MFPKKIPCFHPPNTGKTRSDLMHHETNLEANTQIIHKRKLIPKNSKKRTQKHPHSPNAPVEKHHNRIVIKCLPKHIPQHSEKQMDKTVLSIHPPIAPRLSNLLCTALLPPSQSTFLFSPHFPFPTQIIHAPLCFL